MVAFSATIAPQFTPGRYARNPATPVRYADLVEARSRTERSAGTKAGRPETVCPDFHAAVELIGKRWAGAILWTLAPGPLYFAEIAQAVPGLSDRLLSRRLRELEEVGLVDRTVHDGTPPRVSYELTAKGAELEPAIRELGDWAKRWNLS
jgi:DNA-binding HxlR family transcriptional regulator